MLEVPLKGLGLTQGSFRAHPYTNHMAASINWGCPLDKSPTMLGSRIGLLNLLETPMSCRKGKLRIVLRPLAYRGCVSGPYTAIFHPLVKGCPLSHM